MLPIQIFNQLVLEDEERREVLRVLNIERHMLRGDSDPFSLTEEQFINNFRLTKEMVQHTLLPVLVPHIPTNSPIAIDPMQKILITLAFYASGEYQRCLGDNFRFPISQPTVSKIVAQVTPLFVQYVCPEWIVFPVTREEINRKKRRFMQQTRFPGVLGAIDCTHVAILAPLEQEHNYLNRKGYHSKNAQIVCDYGCEILNINARWGGAVHDSFIFRNSAVCTEMERRYNAGDHNTWLLGDSGYLQKPFPMTPILNAIPDSPEFIYTNRHVRTRVSVERCNGILKARFRCLSSDRKLRYAPNVVGNIINACAALHNICIRGRLEPNFDILHINDHDIAFDNIYNMQQNDAGFLARRQLIARYFT